MLINDWAVNFTFFFSFSPMVLLFSAECPVPLIYFCTWVNLNSETLYLINLKFLLCMYALVLWRFWRCFELIFQFQLISSVSGLILVPKLVSVKLKFFVFHCVYVHMPLSCILFGSYVNWLIFFYFIFSFQVFLDSGRKFEAC